MAKSEINNEFILLRHTVRQARVCIVNKLIKEAKLLRDRHGNEAQREKCRRKADKLIAEVYALKTIKDDEISKFGILDERGLTEILQNQSSSSSIRIMARVAHYKSLNRRLMQFKERFPECKKHLTKNKKSTKLRSKDAAKIRKSKKSNIKNKSSKKQNVDSDENIEQPQYNKEEKATECNSEIFETNNSRKRKETSDEDSTSLEKQKLLELEKNSMEVTDKQLSVIKLSGVTKEVKVKRFAELLKEQEANQDAQTSVENQDIATKQIKMIDDFFITEDNQENDASTSYTKLPRYNTRAKAFQSNELRKDRIKKQNTNRKNDTNFSKKHPSKQSFSIKPKKTTNRSDESVNKSNAKKNMIVNKKNETTSLHPSWMAKKKEQAIMSQGFQGKKIVFTDD